MLTGLRLGVIASVLHGKILMYCIRETTARFSSLRAEIDYDGGIVCCFGWDGVNFLHSK